MSNKRSKHKECGVKAPFGGPCGSESTCQLKRGHKGAHSYWIYSWPKRAKGARRNPKPGNKLAKVEQRGSFSVVNTRIVLAVEKRYPRGKTVVYTRKRANRPCRCTLTEWRRWARTASVPATI